MRRGTAVAAAVAVAAAAAGGGWLAGQEIKSPDQAALEAEPPPASLITVEVERAELTADVITRADVGYDEPAALRLSGAIGDRQSALAVTAAPERGAELAEGSVAIEIAGRPVFLLAGTVPVYRDLRPRDRGPDVQQLEEALARLGHFDGEPDQLWDGATGAAVHAWYDAAGYEAVDVSEDERASLRAASDRVDVARGALADAQDALADMLRGPDGLAVRRARTDRAAAHLALTRARLDAERSGADSKLSATDAELAATAADLSHAEAVRALAGAEQAVADAGWAVGDARAAREQAAHDHDGAQLRWQSAQAGVHPDTGTIPAPAQHEALRRAFAAAERRLAGAERSVEATKRAVDDAVARLGGARQAVAGAEAETARRRAAVPSPAEQAVTAEEAALAVRSADDRMAAAEQALADLLAPPDTAEARQRVDDALDGLAGAEARLADLAATTGVWLPAGELIVLGRLPVRVDLLSAERGTVVSGPFMTVTGSELAVRGSVSERDVDRVVEGAEARIEDRSLEAPIAGIVRLVDRRAGTRDTAPDRHYLEIVAEGIPEHLVGSNVKTVIPVGGTEGTVLVVPAAALSATADGSTRVEVELPDGATRFVTVEPGLSTGGRVEVTPIEGELSAGDRVVVGAASGE